MLYFKTATQRDIELIRALALEIWTTCYPGIISMEQIEYMLGLMYSSETIDKEISEGIIWKLMEYKSEPIGFVSVTISNNGSAKLNKLYMKNNHHGKGFGQQALKHVVDDAKQLHLKQVYLTVNKGNVSAIKAYEKFGFTRIESIVNDIGGGYVMDDFIYCFSIK